MHIKTLLTCSFVLWSHLFRTEELQTLTKKEINNFSIITTTKRMHFPHFKINLQKTTAFKNISVSMNLKNQVNCNLFN